jgi:hypothetical protein
MTYILVILLLSMSTPIFAGTDLELIPRGTRSLGMGGTGAVTSNDAYASFHNPAALCNTSRFEAAVEYSPMWDIGDDIGNGGATFLFADGLSLSAVFSRAEVNNIPMYPDLSGNSFEDRIVDQSIRSTGKSYGFMQNSQDLLMISMARWFKLNARTGEFSRLSVPLTLSAGASLKFQRQMFSVETGGSVPDYMGISTDIDGGFLAIFDLDRNMSDGLTTRSFSAGLVFKNILASDMTYNSDKLYRDDGERIRTVAFGLMQSIPRIKGGVEATVEFTKRGDQKLDRFGGEVLFLNQWTVRGGSIEGEPAFGFGFTHKNIGIDWAYRHHELKSQPYKISISYQLN